MRPQSPDAFATKMGKGLTACLCLVALFLSCQAPYSVVTPALDASSPLPNPSPLWGPHEGALLTEEQLAALRPPINEPPAAVATPQPGPQLEGMTQAELEQWAEQWAYESYSEIGAKIGKLFNYNDEVTYNNIREGDRLSGVIVESLAPLEICFVTGTARVCVPYREPLVHVLLEDDAGIYSWPLGPPPLIEEEVFSGAAAFAIERPCYYLFRNEGNAWFPFRIGKGPDRYRYLNIALLLKGPKSDCVIGVGLDNEAKNWARWGFDADSEWNSFVQEERIGSTAGIPFGGWMHFSIDLQNDLRINSAAMIYGIQLLCMGKDVLFDSVTLSQEPLSGTIGIQKSTEN